jgi:hypothetical protein
MTGYESKRAAARDKLLDDDDTQVYQAWRESASDYERGFIDGMQKQMQSSVDKAVNAMTQRPWVGLTAEEAVECCTTTATQTWKNFEAKLQK